jgi:hypothetical protein
MPLASRCCGCRPLPICLLRWHAKVAILLRGTLFGEPDQESNTVEKSRSW